MHQTNEQKQQRNRNKEKRFSEKRAYGKAEEIILMSKNG